MTTLVVILFIALIIFFVAFNVIDWRRRDEKMLNELQQLRQKNKELSKKSKLKLSDSKRSK
tara:strand:+ start:3503 stop:3685 length:183 start_codon:yes stop_codon:yes gene_type:complete